MTEYVGRFAPSPTGPLHFGSLVAAVASYLDAKAAQGRWYLRIDDVDSTRARADAAAAIPHTLEAFGLQWDGAIQYQSPRRNVYEEALQELIRANLAYPCACTRKEIAAVATRGKSGMIYPGTCRNGLPAGREARSWRFRCTNTPVAFFDRAHGGISIDLLETQGDFLIRRGDGLHAYHLAMVLDDAALGITHVVRGADLLYATAPQVALQQALRLPTPKYWHTSIALSPDGRKLSKTNAAPALDSANPTPYLMQALEFLQLPPPDELAEAPPEAILDWASRHWHRHVIRSVTTGGVECP